jgi:hypothetical protein
MQMVKFHAILVLVALACSHAKLNTPHQRERILKPPRLYPTYETGPIEVEEAPVQAPEVQEPVQEVKDSEKYLSIEEHEKKLEIENHEAHRTFALGFITTVVMASIFASMSLSSNSLVSKHTWTALDTTIGHFLGFSWYGVIMCLLDHYPNATALEKVLAHLSWAVGFILVQLFIMYRLHNDKEAVTVFTGISTPMVMWVNCGFASTVQSLETGPLGVLFNTVLLMAWYALLAVVLTSLVKKLFTPGWGDGEIDKITGKVLACAFILWTHVLITGSFHHLAGPDKNPPKIEHTLVMLGMSAVYFGLAIFAKPKVDKQKKAIQETQYWGARSLEVVSDFIGFLPRFSLLCSLGHLIVHNFSSDGELAAHLALAVASSFVGIALIFIAARKEGDPSLDTLFLGLAGFIIAGAWFKLANKSIDMMAEGEGYWPKFHFQLGLTSIMTAFVFPAYYYHIKPLIMQKG